MWKKISFKGIVIGAVVDVVMTNVWGVVAVIYLYLKYQLLTLPQAEQVNQLHVLFSQDPVIGILGMAIGGAFSILGGYVAARIAKHDELLNGTLSSFLCVLFALFAFGSAPTTHVLLAVIVNPLLGLAGGYLRLWQRNKAKSKERGGENTAQDK